MLIEVELGEAIVGYLKGPSLWQARLMLLLLLALVLLDHLVQVRRLGCAVIVLFALLRLLLLWGSGQIAGGVLAHVDVPDEVDCPGFFLAVIVAVVFVLIVSKHIRVHIADISMSVCVWLAHAALIRMHALHQIGVRLHYLDIVARKPASVASAPTIPPARIQL